MNEYNGYRWAGFVGTNLIKRLLKDGHNVVVLITIQQVKKKIIKRVVNMLTWILEM